jgi:hypothetical protein
MKPFIRAAAKSNGIRQMPKGAPQQVFESPNDSTIDIVQGEHLIPGLSFTEGLHNELYR